MSDKPKPQAYKSDSESSDFTPYSPPTPSKLIELPIQLKDGSWIMLSDVRSIKCHASQSDEYGAVEVNIINYHVSTHIYIKMNNKEAREYADLIGSQWRQSIIDRANHEARLPVKAETAKPQATITDWYGRTGDLSGDTPL